MRKRRVWAAVVSLLHLSFSGLSSPQSPSVPAGSSLEPAHLLHNTHTPNNQQLKLETTADCVYVVTI